MPGGGANVARNYAAGEFREPGEIGSCQTWRRPNRVTCVIRSNNSDLDADIHDVLGRDYALRLCHLAIRRDASLANFPSASPPRLSSSIGTWPPWRIGNRPTVTCSR